MTLQQIDNQAVTITRFVIENGRVTGDRNQEWLDSIENEVKFEAIERGLSDDADMIAAHAVALQRFR